MTDKEEILNFNNSVEDEIASHKNKNDGFIKYYGLYWRKDCIFWEKEQMLAVPFGKTGQGSRPRDALDNWNCVNFWQQKGVYILYDTDMHPVYAGQVGIERKNTKSGNDLGGRLFAHKIGKYRNAWKYFSWFGFLEREKKLTSVRNLDIERQIKPKWSFQSRNDFSLNDLLSSFEAIVIEGFIPRLNSRGGDLKGAIRCDQYEGVQHLSKENH